MNCNHIGDLRVILVPLEHSEKEDLFHELFIEVISYCDNLSIYWETLKRYKNLNSNIKKLGLEDSKLVSLFELILFKLVLQDNRLHEEIYKGTGVKSDKHKGVKIYQKASNIAKGSQAVVNLREYFNNRIKDKLSKEINEFDIEELIREMNNFKLLKKFEDKLLKIYDLLIESLINDSSYSFIDFNIINYHLNKISINNNYFDNLSSASYLKEYTKLIRDISNAIYVIDQSKQLKITNVICCIGSAHTEDLREELIKRGAKVNIIKLMDSIDEESTDEENKKEIKKVIEAYFI